MVTYQPERIFAPRKRTHNEKVLSHAAARFSLDQPLARPSEISRQFRTFLKIEDQRLKMALRCGAPGRQTAAARSSVLDLVVKRAYQAATLLAAIGERSRDPMNGCAVVALGGYGRGELAPYSDLDLLFLHSSGSLQTKPLVEEILRLLWDAGVTVGHSFRSVADCPGAAHADPHFQTALVSTRMLAGDGPLYDALLKILQRDRRKRTEAFLLAIRNERDARYAKFGAAVCLQEPNLKESAGGIRDFHTALWAGYARYGCRTLDELKASEIISEGERRIASRAVEFLWRVRYAAHLSTGRKTERLSLDLQTTLASEFGYEPSAYLLASEAFMRDYYHHARELHRFSETMLARASETDRKTSRWWSRKPSQTLPGEPLSIRNGRLELEGDSAVFTQNPLLFFDAFALAQAASVPFSHPLREALRQSLPLVDGKFRASAEASRAFLKLLSRRGRGGYALRLMHDVGFLARFMPEFERISLLIQHDLYHHYTVDEHTLKAVEALDELHASQDKQRAHLRIIFEEIEDPVLLYLSILLHDIGKGRGRGHIPRGVKIAERVCARLGLPPQKAATVLLMVKEHVAMAQLAQRRDLNERQVVSDFATQVGSLDALNSLMLLTYADLNAVAPGVWSEWKSTLLWELYRRTRTLLTGTDATPDDTEKIARFKEQVVNSLEGSLPISEVERHVALLPDRYVRVTGPQAAAIHIHLIEELKSEVFARRWLRHSRGSTELTICTRDRHGLFADIAGTLAAHGIEILSAELNTREDGIALDVFMLREASTHHAIDIQRYPAIERAMSKAIAGESDIAALVERWRTRHAPRKRNSTQPAKQRNLPQVVCDNEAAQSCTLVEVHAADETGLAYKIASALAALGLDIVCAKIATEKSDALDVFYVTDAEGMKLSPTTMHSVEISLAELLSSSDAGRISV